MTALDVNSLFARAERQFAARQWDAALGDLRQVARLAGPHPAVLHLTALAEKNRGGFAAAEAAFKAALRLAPRDPQIHNNYAILLEQGGQPEAAMAHYEQALSAAPAFPDALYNRALLLDRMGRVDEALAEIDKVLEAQAGNAKALSAQGMLLRKLGQFDAAAAAYDASLAIAPDRAPALHGRARTALERGEMGAAVFYRRALAAKPGDPELELGLAEALEAEGAAQEGLAILSAAVARQPQWAHGQAVLARMRWEAGEGHAFARSFEAALEKTPQDRELWLQYAGTLTAAGLSVEATEAAARGQKACGADPMLILTEAVHRSELGELSEADRLFGALPDHWGERLLPEARHRVRTGDYAAASALIEALFAREPWENHGWAMVALIWRLTGDARAGWLVGQPNLSGPHELDLSRDELIAVAERLRSLHKTRAHPIGQSLRGGTQTRGRLFERQEPEVRLLAQAVRAGVEAHWAALPPEDPTHPLLRHRSATPAFAGSWSVRLTDGGFHISHIHPHGLLSSACYLVVPEDQGHQEGWLEIGGAPDGLDVPVEPLLRVEPRPGRMALFPSYLFHGTRPFTRGERLTAAFDVVAS